METRIVSMSVLQNIYSKHRIHLGLYIETSPWELMDPRQKMTQTKLKTYVYLLTPFDTLTAHKIDILKKQLLCQFEGLLVF